ncbi:MAG: hypothetical protein RBS38_10240 [Bacteroidales bacterium]|jgi:hypothetical protein|nr:hypothetical protein [Bacteroidales bacterium]
MAPVRVRKKARVDIERKVAELADNESEPAYNNDPGTIITVAAVVNRTNRRGKLSAMHLKNLPMKNLKIKTQINFQSPSSFKYRNSQLTRCN